jgi:hypothetical protein
LFRPAPHLHILHQNDAPEITGLDSRSQDILLEHKGVEINLKGTGAPWQLPPAFLTGSL